jgi:protein-S-isoprenylcysteine O-methyltransferase Ste14
VALVYRLLLPFMWLAWVGYWWFRSGNVKASTRREPFLSRLLHIVPLVFAGMLLWLPGIPLVPWLNARFVPLSEWAFWAGAALALAGFLFTVWAREHLGRNWSGIVTVKQDHELIVDGPYALVRHPIYTGLLLAFAGTGLALGEWRGVLAVVIALLALWRKLRIEERWMQEQFGEQYRAYKHRVAALVPFVL